ncbi:KAP family P-loop domain-containing protein [Lutibacter agarilyticus]|uniref:KAP family P-loop domain-containing protein n=1 Tax=Lutibacter agarilyticus TaxID=1109740 RepID=A0A238XQE9_9FLAO|nr:P-loop NTPase fold protein [Lutibacter agarilyticus]SNR60683.1 KAP family P-loop domain-containing protein [Lutibacter agarilyticus]
MSLKSLNIEINPENPFENCKLDRKKYSTILTKIVENYSDGFVLGINNKWGTGKSTFVRMWKQELKNLEYQTVYFNAWENDFENNPLIALMGELKSVTKSSTEVKFKKTLKKAATISKHLTPIIIQAIADKYINTKSLKDAISGVTDSLNDIFENEVNEYSNKKKSIVDFKEELSDFINDSIEKKPLIFIIDELDRCRPNYAVSILEQIKHFFSVPNIVFVLSIDKKELGNAIKGVYGSDRIDTNEYLRRFIDVEYSIPEPKPELFYTFLYDYNKFDNFFNSTERLKYSEFRYDKTEFLKICKLLFSNKPITLRQQEKIFNLAKLSIKSFNPNNFVFPVLFIFLNFIKILYPEFYENLKLKKLTLSQVQDEFKKIVKIEKDENIQRELMWLEGYLLNHYKNYLIENHYYREKLFEKDTNGENKLLVKSVVGNDQDFLGVLEGISYRSGGDLGLDYLMDKIDLFDSMTI